MALVATVADLWESDTGIAPVNVGDIIQIVGMDVYEEEYEPEIAEQFRTSAERIYQIEKVTKESTDLFSYTSHDENGNEVQFFDWEINLIYRPSDTDHIESVTLDNGNTYKVFICTPVYTDGGTGDKVGMLLGTEYSFDMSAIKDLKEHVALLIDED